MSGSNSSPGSILHLIETIGPGGAETVFLQVAEGLGRRGLPPRLVVHGPGWVLENARDLDLPVDVIPSGGPLDWRLLWRLRQLVRRHNVRLVHAHLAGSSLYASLLGAWVGIPVVSTFHGRPDFEYGGWSRRFRYGIMSRHSTPVCVSEALLEDLSRVPGMSGSDIRVIHNGVDIQIFADAHGARVRREHGIPDGAVLVGGLGNVRPAKDYTTLLKAAARLARDQRYVFAVAGERTEPLHEELLRLRDDLGLRDRFSFWGFRTDAPEVLAAFDVLAISSSSEGFSLVAVQAMAAGTPVVATRSGGPEEIITHEDDGILVPPRSPDALAAGIRRVVEEVDFRKKMVREARRTAQARFSLRSMLDGYEALYLELTGRRASSEAVRSSAGGPGRTATGP